MAVVAIEEQEYGALLRGDDVKSGDVTEIWSPYDGSLVGRVHRACADDVEQAIAAAVRSFQTTRRLASWQREDVLKRVAESIRGRREEFARTIALEAGKPIKAARIEVDRAAFTFTVAAEESKRIYGEIVPLDWLPETTNRVAHIQRVPLGPISGITPFNFPLNLVAHKVAPALAAGNPILLRPASQTPVSSLLLGRMLVEAGWPPEAVAVLPCSTAVAAPLVEDDRIELLTFTGSPEVGWGLKSRAGRKHVTLELGGNAAVIVHEDADVGYAAERVAWGGFVFSGQTCISVQRVFVHSSHYEAFLDDLVKRVSLLQVGDPLDESTDIGPVIDSGNAARVGEWLDEAVSGGAVIAAGGVREGNIWHPTVLTGVQDEMRVSCEEVFAPIVTVTPFDDVDAAIDAAGRSRFGLQAGIFTHDQRVIDAAFDGLDVGGLMVNDVSTFRIDHMPYGGVKSSGMGREGLRYTIEEMTRLKLVTYNRR
jgi:acyl-CoA reductase-like NAD-dependent aldehyde dehydrogenase